MITLTAELIEALMTAKGGWNSKTLHHLGVNWPPVSGWKARLVGAQISEKAYKAAQKASGNNRTVPAVAPGRKPNPRASAGSIIAWLRAHWSEVMEGAALCDQCPAREIPEPCKACPHWEILVDSYRKGDV